MHRQPSREPRPSETASKNTNRKKTNKQNTRPLPPGARSTRPRGQTPPAARTAPAPADLEPGVRLLLAIGAQRPELLLTDQVLTDQGRTVTVMLDAGWTREQLQHVISDRPLPSPVRTTVGAIIAARLRAAQSYPPPTVAADHLDQPVQDAPRTQPGTGSAARTVSEALTYRALVECAGCGLPGIAPGEDLCPACLDWPTCRTCPGPTPRRAHPDGDGRCTTCASAVADQPEGSSP